LKDIDKPLANRREICTIGLSPAGTCIPLTAMTSFWKRTADIFLVELVIDSDQLTGNLRNRFVLRRASLMYKQIPTAPRYSVFIARLGTVKCELRSRF
jgi:hypothetical protein